MRQRWGGWQRRLSSRMSQMGSHPPRPCHGEARAAAHSSPPPCVLCRLTQVRWSRYNPSYLEPEVNKELYQKPFEELSEEEKEKMELKAVRPIKAAPPTLSSSVFSDPMIRSERASCPLLQLGPTEPKSLGAVLSSSAFACCAARRCYCTIPLFRLIFFPQSQSID